MEAITEFLNDLAARLHDRCSRTPERHRAARGAERGQEGSDRSLLGASLGTARTGVPDSLSAPDPPGLVMIADSRTSIARLKFLATIRPIRRALRSFPMEADGSGEFARSEK